MAGHRRPDDRSAGSAGRRQFLGALGAAATPALAGCRTPSGLEYDYSQSDFDPPAVPYDEIFPQDEDISMFRRGLRRLGYYPNVTVPDAVEVAWKIPVNHIGHTAAKASPRPAPDGETLVVPADTGHVHAVSPLGERRWTAQTGATHLGIHGTPTIVDGVAYVGGYDGDLYALDVETGDRVWRLRNTSLGLPTAIGSSPAYWDGVLYFQAEYLNPETGALWAVDATTGTPLWSDYRPHGMPHPSPAIDPASERLVVGSNDGVVYAWEFPSMEFVWNFETGGEVKGTPPVYEGRTYVGSWDGNVYCLNLVDGEEEWRFETGGIVMSNPGVDPESNTVFFGGGDDYVRALDAETGGQRWATDVNNDVIGSLTVTDDAVLAGSYDTHLYALEKDTGEVRWRIRGNGHATSEAVPHDGHIYYAERADLAGYWDDEETVVEEPGYVYCLRAVE